MHHCHFSLKLYQFLPALLNTHIHILFKFRISHIFCWIIIYVEHKHMNSKIYISNVFSVFTPLRRRMDRMAATYWREFTRSVRQITMKGRWISLLWASERRLFKVLFQRKYHQIMLSSLSL